MKNWIWLGLLASSMALADRDRDIEKTLQAFQRNPRKVINQKIQKWDANGQAIPASQVEGLFDKASIRSRNFVTQKHNYRDQICTHVKGSKLCVKDMRGGRSPFQYGDLAENLVDNKPLVRNIQKMQTLKLTKKELKVSPWSSDYWGLYKGVIAARYADSSFPTSEDWKTNHSYEEKHSILPLFTHATLAPKTVDELSPAEKYDLVVGDEKATLTQAMWAQGQQYYKDQGKVETWMGICHGWSPASYMYPRPEKAVTVTAADGKTKVRFYPTDIKALGSLLWAQTSPESRFIGGRCDEKNPKTDSKTGRVVDDACADTNPGTWHMAVVNQIGVAKRSFVMDATYDYEVWNQPVLSYSYTYFNPQTNKAAKTLGAARVEISKYTNDKFKDYRTDKNTKYVVGVAMDVTYVVETIPSHALTDSASEDATRTAQYLYDLELDAKGNILGGEWYNNDHPDFLWTPAPDTEAVSSGDQFATGHWDGKGPVPDSWTKAAQAASQEGQPLAKLVNKLFDLAAPARSRE